MDSGGSRIKNADILITDNEITEIGFCHALTRKPEEIIDAKGKIALPGFVNTHHHTFQSLVRNIHAANGLKLEPWLSVVYRVFEGVTPAVAQAGTLAGLGDLLKTGFAKQQYKSK